MNSTQTLRVCGSAGVDLTQREEKVIEHDRQPGNTVSRGPGSTPAHPHTRRTTRTRQRPPVEVAVANPAIVPTVASTPKAPKTIPVAEGYAPAATPSQRQIGGVA